MKRFYKLILLLLVFIFLTTYNSAKIDLTSKNNGNLFKIKNIEVIDNSLIEEDEIKKKIRKYI